MLKGQLISSSVLQTPPPNLNKLKCGRRRGCERYRKLAFNTSGNTISSTLEVASTRPDVDICYSKILCLRKLALIKNLTWVEKFDPNSKMIQMKKRLELKKWTHIKNNLHKTITHIKIWPIWPNIMVIWAYITGLLLVTILFELSLRIKIGRYFGT